MTKTKKLPDEICIKWHIEDVIEEAEEDEIKLTKNEARKILQEVLRHHDCTIGITWDTLNAAIHAFKEDTE